MSSFKNWEGEDNNNRSNLNLLKLKIVWEHKQAKIINYIFLWDTLKIKHINIIAYFFSK